MTDGKPPLRKIDKDPQIKTQHEWGDRESIRKRLGGGSKKETVGKAFATVLIRPSETSFSASHAFTPAAVCDCVILHLLTVSLAVVPSSHL